MGNVPQNKPVAVAVTDVLHRHTTNTRGGGRCPFVCHVRRRFQRLAHFDNDALPEARSPRLRTPPIHSFSGRLIVLYFSNTNATGVVVAVKPHLELRRKYTKFGGRCQFRSLAMLMYPVRRWVWMMLDQNTTRYFLHTRTCVHGGKVVGAGLRMGSFSLSISRYTRTDANASRQAYCTCNGYVRVF